jgi:hypothetical protein
VSSREIDPSDGSMIRHLLATGTSS